MKNITLTIVTLLCMNINYAAETDFQKSIPQFFRNYAYFENDYPKNFHAKIEFKRILETIESQDLSQDSFYQSILNYKNNRKESCEINPLEQAIIDNNLQKIAWLIAIKMPINQLNTYGYTPLHQAFITDNMAAAQLLLNAQADVNIKDINDNTPLHIACYYNNLQAIEKLIAWGANINAIDTKKFTPLHQAVLRNSVQAADALLNYGAHILRDSLNCSPIDYAATDEMIEVFSDSKIV